MQKEDWVVLIDFNRLKELLGRFSHFILGGESLLKIDSELLNILWINFHFDLLFHQKSAILFVT